PSYRGLTLTPTPHGIEVRTPRGAVVPMDVVPASSFPSATSPDAYPSLVAEITALHLTTYEVEGQAFPMPMTHEAFTALPPAHQQAITNEFSVGGDYDPATDKIRISEDHAHVPDVYREELGHAIVARMTPEERAAHGITDQDTEEQAIRQGLQPPADI